MHLSLSGKLFLTALALAVASVALVLVLTWLSLGRGFSEYVAQSELNRMDRLTEELLEYQKTDGLSSLADQPTVWAGLLHRGLAPPRRLRNLEDRLEPARPPPPPVRALIRRLALIGPDGQVIVGGPRAAESDIKRPLTEGSELLGWLVLAPSERLSEGIASRFVAAQGRNILFIGFGSVLLAGLAALLLGRHLSRPLTAMAKTTQGLRDGDYALRVTSVQRHDELGNLANDINALAAALEMAEAGRRRWVQDTAHELRTPLSSLRAELEALQDGVRPVDQDALARLHTQTMTLAALVEDLRALSDADGGRLSFDFRRQSLWPLVESAIADLQSRAERRDLEIVAQDRRNQDDVADLDGQRISQVLRNLISNSLAYSDPGGHLEIALTRQADALHLTLDDTPPGVTPEHLPHLFDRFYRVEGSRSRATGGRGLGLAICQAIVTAHKGTLRASASPLGGLRLEMTLPLAASQKRDGKGRDL
ncbi:MAG: ATP-binding protein [Rhodospirillales bacterium]